MVYKLSESDPNKYVFDSLWNPDEDYSDDCYIVPLRSTYVGLSEEYKAGTCFANVIGSTPDPKYKTPELPYGVSWIEIIRRAYKADGEKYKFSPCCANQKVYDSVRNSAFKIICKGVMCGAHVLMEKTESSTVADGEDVLLLPLCNEHNTYNKNNQTYNWGSGYYMQLNRPMKAVILKGYMKEPDAGTLPPP